ncbi:MAG: PD-(D/E)XK nuclease family protein [bacterium]
MQREPVEVPQTIVRDALSLLKEASGYMASARSLSQAEESIPTAPSTARSVGSVGIGQYRKFLRRAEQSIRKREVHTTEHRVPPTQVPHTAFKLSDAQRFYDEAHGLLRSRALGSLDDARQALLPFRSLPLPFSPFDVMNAESLERAFQAVIYWLLDPSARHGMGDRFLRRFLTLTGVADLHHMIRLSESLKPMLLQEFRWETNSARAQPHEGLWDANGRRPVPSVRCDLVILLPPHLVAIELKVTSDERTYQLDGLPISQAALYERSLALVCAFNRGESSIPVYSTAAHLDREQYARIIASAERRSPALAPILKECTRIHGVLVHLSHECDRKNERPVPADQGEWRRRIQHIDWRDVARILADLRHHQTVDGGSASIMDGLRQAIYRCIRTEDDEDLMVSAETLRLFSDEPHLLRRWPQETNRLLKVILSGLTKRPECVRSNEH